MSLIRKGIFVSSGRVMCTAVSLFAGIILARKIGPDYMGQYDLLRTTGMLVVTIFALGLHNANIFFINNRGHDIGLITTNTFKYSIFACVSVTFLLGFCLLFFKTYFGQLNSWIGCIFAIGVGFRQMYLLLRTILSAELRAREIVIVEFIQPITLLIGFAVLLIMGKLDINTCLSVLAFSNFLTMVWVLKFLWPYIQFKTAFDWPVFKDTVIYGLKLSAAGLLFVFASQVTVMLLRLLIPGSFYQIGLYSRAVALTALVILIPRSVTTLLMAKWSAVDSQQARCRQMQLTARIYVTYSLVMAVFVTFVGKYLLWLLFGVEYVPAHSALTILIFGAGALALAEVWNQGFASDGKAMVTAKILLGTLIIITVSCMVLIPYFDIVGAAISASLGYFFYALAGMLISRKLYGIKISRCLWIKKTDIALIINSFTRQSK